VNVSGGDLDGDGYDEILTGPGPGAIFGPHVRGWNVDGGPATVLPGSGFFAYGTRKYGAVVGAGDADGDGYDEILTAPGPGAVFSAHIRGWNYSGASITPLQGCNFFAWPLREARYGGRINAGADLDSDGRAELVAGCGPDPLVHSSPVKGFRYDGGDVTAWFSFQAYPSSYTHGTNVASGRFLIP